MRLKDRDTIESGILVAPGVALIVVAFILPILRILQLGLVDDEGAFTTEHLVRFLSDPYYLGIVWRTIRLSVLITLICAAVGFSLAYIMAQVDTRLRLWMSVLLILPLMTSVVIRTFGWLVLLGRGGLVADMLQALWLVDRNFTLMHTEIAVVIGMVHILLPFMTISVLGVMMKIDQRLDEAARTMGAGFFTCVRLVTIPLAMPGLIAGSILVFTLSASSFITPNLLGGVRLPVIAGSIYESAIKVLDWPFAAAQSIILLIGILLVLIPYAALLGGRRG